jgi:hypothetical protein
MSSGDVTSSLPTFQGASRGKRDHKVMRTMELIHIFWPDLEKTVQLHSLVRHLWEGYTSKCVGETTPHLELLDCSYGCSITWKRRTGMSLDSV